MKAFKIIVEFVAGFFLLAGLSVFGYQAILWYKSGKWFGIDLLSTIYWLHSTQAGSDSSSPLLNWFYAPQNWLGLHGSLILVLDIVPLALFLVVIGSFLFAAVERREKERSEIIDAVEQEMRDKQAAK